MQFKNGSIAFKSSVTGAFILLISFAFFWLYIYQVEPVRDKEIGGAKPEVKQLPPSSPSAPGPYHTRKMKVQPLTKQNRD
jgi:hypothetical protein